MYITENTHDNGITVLLPYTSTGTNKVDDAMHNTNRKSHV